MEKYQIERIIGRGAYGTVYLCKTISEENSLVIIKQIPIDQMSLTDRQVCNNTHPVLSDSGATLKFQFCMLKNTSHTDFQLKFSIPGILAAIISSGKKL